MPAWAVTDELGAVHVIADRLTASEGEDEPVIEALVRVRLDRQEAAQDGRDLGRRREAIGHLGHGDALARAPRGAFLGERDQFDHALVGLTRRLAEAEDAVLQQDQSLAIGIGGEDLRGLLGQVEARHDVGHERRASAIDLAADLVAVGLVGDREHRVRVGVVDKLVRQEGMQQGLDRWVGRRRIEQIAPLHVDHVLVAQLAEPGEFAHRLQAHGGQPRRLDRGHVPAAALDAEHLDIFAGDVGLARLDRGVATAVQHQAGHAAQEARCVDPKRQVLVHALLVIALDGALGLAVAPETFHIPPPSPLR